MRFNLQNPLSFLSLTGHIKRPNRSPRAYFQKSDLAQLTSVSYRIL